MRFSSVLPALLFAIATCVSAQTSPDYTPPVTCTAKLPQPFTAGPQTPQFVADRNNAEAPAILAANCRDYEASYQLYLRVLNSYPDDASVLLSTALAAVRAGHDDVAIPLYKRTFQPGAKFTMGAHSALMNIYIRQGRWDDFEAERLAARADSVAGKLTMSRDQPFQIEQLRGPQEFFDVYEFATLYGPNHVRVRFDLREEKDICTEFTPYFDLVASDPSSRDDGAAAAYSLFAFPAPNTQWLVKTYAKGEPPYQTVRADVLSAMNTPLTAFKPGAQCRTPAPTAGNGGLSANAAR